MKIFLALVSERKSPEKSRNLFQISARTNAKSRAFPVEWQLQRPMKPRPINSLSALRDGATCSEGLW
jgi:hypothetical protein